MLREKIQHSVEVKMKQFAPPKGVLTVSERAQHGHRVGRRFAELRRTGPGEASATG